MNNKIIKKISEIWESITDRTNKRNKILEAGFIKALEQVGMDKAAEKVKKFGLPSNIVVSEDIYETQYDLLSKFSKVSVNKTFDEKAQLVLLWCEIEDKK